MKMMKKLALLSAGLLCALAVAAAPASRAFADEKCGTGKCGGDKKPVATPTPAPGDGKCGTGKCGGGK